MADETLAARLAAIREPAERTVAMVAGRGWASGDDAWDEAGPMGVAEWSAAKNARTMLRLVAAADAVLELHVPLKTDPYLCRECRHVFPCWTLKAITRELTGGSDA